MKLLVVDDEPAILDALRPVLKAAGHECETATSAREALSIAGERTIDLVLLDLGLPDADGIDIISRLKDLADASVIILSARHLESDMVRALDEGADDYVNKPFGVKELLARLRVAERRRKNLADDVAAAFVSRELTVDFDRRDVRLFGDEVKLSPKEFQILEALCRSAGQVVTQRKLLVAGWNDPTADAQYLRSYIALLRQKLEYDPAVPELVLTEPGVGYRLGCTPIE